MKRTFRPVLVLVAALVFLGARQDASVVDKIIDEGRTRSEVMAHLDHLTNSIGPRLTSSDRLTRACGWARHQFESWGLKNCRLEQWGTFPVGFNRGTWTGRMIAPEELDLTFATMAWTPGTKGPVQGRAVMGPSSEKELDELKHNLKGAWVLSPGTSTGRELNEKILAAYEEAGIAGLIRRGGEKEFIRTGGNHRIGWDKLPNRVNIVLLQGQYDRVKELIADGKEVTLKFDIRNEFTKGPIPLYNVIAEIPGTEKPEEMVIVGGHIDSWDGATGTTDNGTGTATTLEAARLLMKAGAKPKRTIRFMLWSGEEQGLLGSAAFIKAHPEENDRISAVLVHDGGTNYVSGILATKPMVPLFEKIFAPAKSLNKDLPFTIKEVQGLPRGIGSDHDAYLGVGVPGFFWSQDGKAVYNRTHHTQIDTYDAAISEYQQHTSMVVAIGALGIANLDDMLPRKGLTSPPRRMLGIQTREDGVSVDSIEPGTAAERAGLKPGDKILKLGDKAIKSNEELVKSIQEAEQKSTLLVLRDGKETELKVAWDRDPGFRAAEDGVTVTRIRDGVPMAKGGLKEGDKILQVDGKDVKDGAAIRSALREAGKKLKVRILRGGKEQDLEVEFEW